jgi:transcriptional regulator GlxA family with amidase domain
MRDLTQLRIATPELLPGPDPLPQWSGWGAMQNGCMRAAKLQAIKSDIGQNLDRSDLSVATLAARVAMSPRNFARVFARELGTTPARFVEQIRVEAARRRLEESAHGVDLIASECGFGSAESMRRSFVRTLRVPPSAYRSRFQTAVSA